MIQFLGLVSLLTTLFLSPRYCLASPQILIFGATIRSAHAPIIPVAGQSLLKLFSTNGFQARFIQNAEEFNKTELHHYQTIVLLDVSEGLIHPDQKKALELFFEQGGGIVAIHASISVGKDWPWFQDLVGTTFVDHAAIQSGVVRLTSPSHPANQNLPPTWTQTDEWYNFSSRVGPPAIILAVAEEGTFEGGKMGSSHPIIWARQAGKGRFWYTGLGHSASLYTDANGPFSKLLLCSVRWTSKQEK